MSWSGVKVLVTGGSGFVGRWLIRRVVAEGGVVTNVDRVRPADDHGAAFVQNDLESPVSFAEVIDEVRPEVVIHLAGQAGVATCRENPTEAFDANIAATMTVLEGMRAAAFEGIRSVVATSSNHVYGEQESRRSFRETDPLNGLGTYAATKVCADILCRCYAHEYGLPVSVARITNSFGGDDPHASHIVTATVMSCLRGERPVIKRSGLDTKAFLHIEDTVDGILALAAATRDETALVGRAFNIVPAAPVTVLELVRTIMRVTGVTGEPVVELPNADAEFEHLSGDSALEAFGWSPSETLEESLSRTVGWYRDRQSVAA